MLLSFNTRAAKATGDAQKHGKCSGEWTKRSKVSQLKSPRFWGMSFMIYRSAGPDPIATL